MPSWSRKSKVEPTRPFWTRTKVGISSGLVGLLIGIGGGSVEEAPATDIAKAKPDDTAIAALLDSSEAEVESLEESLEALEAQSDEAVAVAVSEAVAETKAAMKVKKKLAVARVKERERARARELVQDAEQNSVQTFADTESGSNTDPRFDTCGDANDAGYGSYRRGVDAEYDWYDDRDNDGIVCEF